MRKILMVSLMTLMILLSACSYKEHNDTIARMNTERFQAFTTGMNGATTEGARIAMAMAFASGMGQQSLVTPETLKDYMVVGIPYARLAYDWFGTSREENSFKAGGDIYYGSTKSNSDNLSHSTSGQESPYSYEGVLE
jgi:hypothetical protein